MISLLSSLKSNERSNTAPLGTLPAVGKFLVTPVPDSPETANPPTETGPCAMAYTLPSGPYNGVDMSVPPAREVASPMEDIVQSNLCPLFANGGMLADTTTAATFFTLRRSGSTTIPMFLSMLARDLMVNSDPALSPVPLSPTTSP